MTTRSQSMWFEGGCLHVSTDWVLTELAMPVDDEAQVDVFVALKCLIADRWPGLPFLVRVHHKWGGITTVDVEHHRAWVS